MRRTPYKSSESRQKSTAGGNAAKVLIAVFLDRDVHEWLQTFGDEYSSEINRILRAEMERAK